MSQALRDFYDQAYHTKRYAPVAEAESHAFFHELTSFVANFGLQDQRCLEVGCGRGAFQDIVTDYTGIDISDAVEHYFHKPFLQASATELPFADNSFDAVWSYAVLEHVPNPEKALEEMRRVVSDGGFLLLAPAWQCRSWAANGYPVRPYSSLDLPGKITKASIPIRNSIGFRAMNLAPRRLVRLSKYLLSGKAASFEYKELSPNYEHYWMSDSDAINSMDPFNAILWFVSRGDYCLNYPSWRTSFTVRTGPLIFEVHKSQRITGIMEDG